ncbi:MAG: anhydro-N-acetylmuramic acid kinase [Bacteroidota bacterium]
MSANRRLLGIGTMSGTSMDGLDIALCEFLIGKEDQYSVRLLKGECIPFDETWYARLYHIREQSAETYAKTHVYFGRWMGRQLNGFIERHAIKPDFVAIHGQTIFHQPEKEFTAQIGDGETVVSYLPCPLVSNFRNKDLALGGEGAPLIPMGERYLFPDYKLFLNLGGFANVTYGHQAFDISPCNIILNYIFQKACPDAETDYDPDGKMAASGKVCDQLLGALDDLDYYKRTPPKSLGWEWVEANVLPILAGNPMAPEHLLRTLVEHIAGQIADHIEQLKVDPQKILITGGGQHHRFLMQILTEKLKAQGIEIADGIDPNIVDYKEAMVFAFLGLRALEGRPTTLAQATGAQHDVVTGSIHLPPQGGWRLVPAD